MIAFKFTHDNCYKLKYWSEWAGMCKADIVSLELLTLQALNYELVVGNDDFDHWARAYSERCRQPHSSSLTAAVIVYVLVVRRMKSTTSVPQDMPASPTVFGRSDSRQSFGSETSEGNDSYPSTPDSAIGTSDISIDFGETRFGTASVYHDTLYGKHVNVAPCHSTPAIQPTCYTNATSARYHEVMQYMSRHGSRYMPYAKHAYTSQYV
jgi:hypothetical protein